MKAPVNAPAGPSVLRLTTHVITEKLARQRFNDLLDAEHTLSSRRPKGRSLYQVVCRGDEWVGLVLWTGALWHLKARDLHLGWDRLIRSERLQLIVHQARFLIPNKAREPNLASACLAASARDLPIQWEECFGYRPLLAESFTDPESHAGTCYKASGWEAVGFSGRDGRHYAERLPEPLGPKKLWIKTLHPHAKALLCSDSLPEAYRAGLAAHVAERSALKAPQLSSLFEAFQKVPDPRSRCARAFPIGAVLALVALGLLRGAVHLSAIVRSAQKLSQDQRRRLRLPCKKGTRFVRVPGYSVFREVLRRVKLDDLARVLTLWMQAHAGELPRTLAIDGKTIRDHLGLIVTLVDTEEGVPVAVLADTRGKGHELKTVQKLLASPDVSLTNAVITADSLHCQDQTAHIITREKGADYVTQVRDNQPILHAYAQKQLAEAPPFFLHPKVATDARISGNSVPSSPMPMRVTSPKPAD
jgi:hypothetical protein